MREGWEYKKFENCIVKSPKLKQVKKEAYNNGSQYPIISQEEKFISGYCDDESIVCHIDRPIVVFGDHTRVLKYIDFDFVVGADGVKVIIPIKSIDSKFLLYFLQWYNIPNLGYSRHYKLLKDITVPIPHGTTQKTIVSELDKLNELIQIKKEQLKDYDALAQSIFYEMFGDPVVNEKGWEVKKLMEVCDVRDGTHDSPKYVESSNYMLITSKNIVNRSISFDDVNYITEEDYNNINKRSKVDNGDILMPMIGTIGNPVIVYLDNLHKFSIKNVALIKFLHNTSILNRYLLELMISESFRRYLLSLNKGGTQKFVALGTIRRMDIILPPLPLQHSFAQKIEQIEQQKAAIQKTITDLETLLAARMQYWFD